MYGHKTIVQRFHLGILGDGGERSDVVSVGGRCLGVEAGKMFDDGKRNQTWHLFGLYGYFCCSAIAPRFEKQPLWMNSRTSIVNHQRELGRVALLEFKTLIDL
jgi:hypothetical protein